MRIISTLAATLLAAPALAHPGTGFHIHETDGFWIAAAVFTAALVLTLRGVVKAARAEK